jgi:hypothetical protein
MISILSFFVRQLLVCESQFIAFARDENCHHVSDHPPKHQ